MPKIQLSGKHLKIFETMGQRVSITPAEAIALLKKLNAEIISGGKHTKARLPSTRSKTMVPYGKISPGVSLSIYSYLIRHGVTAEGAYKYDN